MANNKVGIMPGMLEPCLIIIPLLHWQNLLNKKDYYMPVLMMVLFRYLKMEVHHGRKFTLSNIKGIPSTPFVNDVRADLFDENVVYAALDNHKYGDYKPYLIKSTDKGKSWTLMNGDLPTKLLTWRLVQDHVKKDLLFLATEDGIYFTNNGGTNWIQLKGGIPTISFRDITIQRRENDLVAASFGRGFFILDDITPLRDFNTSMLSAEATMFSIKPA